MRQFLLIAILFISVDSLAISQESDIQFNRDVRPILSDKCYACHGPDASKRESGLRLDLPLPANSDIIVPGDIEESELIARILSDDEYEVMPPSDHLKQLNDREKQVLKSWVQGGAKWQDHWAFVRPVRPTTDPSADIAGDHKPGNFIDHHISSRLTRLNIGAAVEADRRTLIRRLYFDIIGIPPTWEQVQRFLHDESPDAYEKVVDELLASPHFGERMAIYWLDLVRYADSVGYHGDQEISASPFRDYVINAFNKNLPFDQFTREQIAGDLLESPTQDQLVASGFNRLGMMSAEGGAQAKEYLAKYAAERVRTTSSVWLGITLGCAECHDHKFDPFSIEDFYNFASFFADIKERGVYEGASSSGKFGPTISIPDEDLAERLQPIDAELERLTQEWQSDSDEFREQFSDWLVQVESPSGTWTPLPPAKFDSQSKTKFQVRRDHSVLIEGSSAAVDTYAITYELPPRSKIRGLRIEALADKSLPAKGPGRAGNGNFVVTELLMAKGDWLQEMDQLQKPYSQWPESLAGKRVDFKNASASFEQPSSAANNPYGKWSANSAIDRDEKGASWGWAVQPKVGQSHELVVQFDQALDTEQVSKVTVVLQQNHGTQHTLGAFRVSVTQDKNAVVDWKKRLPKKIVSLLGTERSDEDQAKLAIYYRNVAPQLEEIRSKIKTTEEKRTAVVNTHTRTSPITVAVAPRQMRILPRGNWMDDSGKIAVPKVPAQMSQIQKEGRATRLDLANWIVDPTNPLTARVYVNRVWKLFFGTGLSKVLDDLGSQGELPVNPELLDALALKFVEKGWDSKYLIKTMVMSQTYRQSSLPRAELGEIDPYNRLHGRQSRFRLDAEMIRDNALAVSGLLVTRVGGRSAKPYQPEGLYRHLNFPKRKYQQDRGGNQYRRGVYTHWQRQFLHPAMKSFDAPSREECTCERPRSNTPLGALVLLNDPSFVEAARNFASQLLAQKELTEEQERIQWMMKHALSRPATEEEVRVLTDLLGSHRAHFADNEEAAKKLIEIGLSVPPQEVDAAELAAWTSIARTLMNLHEFIVRF